MGTWWTHQLVQYILEHHWLTHHQYIQSIQHIWYIHCICTLCYPLHGHFFIYGTKNDPPSPLHESSAESVTYKGNPAQRNNPPNPVPNVPDDPDSDQSFSYFSSPYLSDSSDDDYSKQRRRTKKNKNKRQSKTIFMTISKSAQSLQPTSLQPLTNQRT